MNAKQSRHSRLGYRAKSVGSYLKRNIDEVVIVLYGIQPRDLDNLPLAEVLSQSLERGIGHSLMTGSLLNVGQRGALPIGEERACLIFRKRVELLHPQVFTGRHRPCQIRAKATSVDLGDERYDHVVQLGLQPNLFHFEFHDLVGKLQRFRYARGHDLYWSHNFSKLSPRPPMGEAHHESFWLLDRFQSHCPVPFPFPGFQT